MSRTSTPETKHTSLSWQEKITVAYAHHVLGHKQQEIVVHYPGINSGRIAEACQTIETAAKK